MATSKAKEVFFDIETLQTNTSAKNARDRVVREYSVSYEYRDNKNVLQGGVLPNLHAFIELLLTLKYKNFKLIAHNGSGFDFHFLRRMLIDDYDLTPVTRYSDAYIDHNDNEYKLGDLLKYPYYLLESRVKSKTNLDIAFKIGNKRFITEDSYPHFQESIRTLGLTLLQNKLIEEGGQKLEYDYDRYDRKEKVEDVRGYALQVFHGLSEHEIQYVKNDTDILRTAWESYNKIYPEDFDINKKTISLNILAAYSKTPLATYQLTHRYNAPFSKKQQSNQLSQFSFMDTNMFEYMHRFYHGGLNFYNDKYVGKEVHDLVHIDINSSYPTVMHNEKFPTFLLRTVEKETVLKLNPNNYYFLQVPVDWVTENVLKNVDSINVRKMFVKYFPEKSGYVYLQSPHIEIFSRCTGKKITEIPVKSAAIFDKRPFGGRDVINELYKRKTEAKKKHLDPLIIRNAKLLLNGIYGIPALRAYFITYKYENGELVAHPCGNKNTERNVIFAAAVTAYAFRNLLMPLTYNIAGIDEGYVYTDTDSHFLKIEYWETIKAYVNIHPTNLGAWDLEHKHIKSMVVLNHKKYCLLNDEDKIEVYSGGIPKDAFKTDMPFEEFVKTQFSDGVEIVNLKHAYTKDGVICLYNGVTKILQGGVYPDHYSKELGREREMYLIRIMQITATDPLDDALYAETTIGSFGDSDLMGVMYNIDNGKTVPVSELIRIERLIANEID